MMIMMTIMIKDGGHERHNSNDDDGDDDDNDHGDKTMHLSDCFSHTVSFAAKCRRI